MDRRPRRNAAPSQATHRVTRARRGGTMAGSSEPYLWSLRMSRPPRLAALLVALPFLLACGESVAPQCRNDADCGLARCDLDGRCVPAPDGGTSPADAGPGDGGPSTDGGDGGPAGCVPNHDGIVARSEVVLAPGLEATFRIASDVDVDTAGEFLPDGTRSWNLDVSLAGDHDATVALRSPDGAWWADDFPDATYAARMRDGDDLFGVFEATGDALRLLGIVSETGGALATNLVYDPPVTVLSFPLEAGAQWRTDTTVSGTATGVWSWYTETYVDRVDATGRLLTPYGEFPVLRVRAEASRTVGVLTTEWRTFMFEAECYGTVATLASDDGETGAELTHAAEVRRLAP